jgi:hypothetical protein
MRFRPVNSSGTRGSSVSVGSTVMQSPTMWTPTPSEVRIWAVMPTSPTSGALVIVLGAVPRIAATMCLVTAFFEPAISTSPTSGPFGSICQAEPAGESMAADITGATGAARTRPRPTEVPFR